MNFIWSIKKIFITNVFFLRLETDFTKHFLFSPKNVSQDLLLVKNSKRWAKNNLWKKFLNFWLKTLLQDILLFPLFPSIWNWFVWKKATTKGYFPSVDFKFYTSFFSKYLFVANFITCVLHSHLSSTWG